MPIEQTILRRLLFSPSCSRRLWPGIGQLLLAGPFSGQRIIFRGDFVPERVNLGKSDPALYQAVIGLEKLAAGAVASAGIPDGLAHLLRLRASQLNQCAFCIRMHTRDALSSGESSDRISVLTAWRETGYFSEKERSSLALVEAITLISDGQVPDAVYDQAAANLSKDEISAVEWLSVVINAWNRIATSSRYPVKP
jgi:AhpD family alkylhydroperoxidase